VENGTRETGATLKARAPWPKGLARRTSEMPMPPVRVLACGLMLLIGGSAHAARLLDETELSQVHAAGLPDAAQPAPHELTPWLPALQEQSAALERQQSLAQYRLSMSAAQSGIGVMQTLSLASLATPLAPLFLPTLALPLPFLMLPPPKNPPPKP
jgi:hypothetical protein